MWNRSRDLATVQLLATTNMNDHNFFGHRDLSGLLYYVSGSPVISTVAPKIVRELISTRSSWESIGQLAQIVIERQLALHNQGISEARKRFEAGKISSLFDAVATKIARTIANDPVEDAKVLFSALPPSVAFRSFWRSDNLPYAAFCAAQSAMEPDGNIPSVSRATKLRTDMVTLDFTLNPDVDEWCVPLFFDPFVSS